VANSERILLALFVGRLISASSFLPVSFRASTSLRRTLCFQRSSLLSPTGQHQRISRIYAFSSYPDVSDLSWHDRCGSVGRSPGPLPLQKLGRSGGAPSWFPRRVSTIPPTERSVTVSRYSALPCSSTMNCDVARLAPGLWLVAVTTVAGGELLRLMLDHIVHRLGKPPLAIYYPQVGSVH